MNVPEERLTFMEAAERLGISKNAARMRVQRGTLASVRTDGVTYVLWPPRPADSSERSGTNDERAHARASERAVNGTNELLVAALNERIASLEQQLADVREDRSRWHAEAELRAEESRRKDHLLAGLIERLPALPETASETSLRDATLAQNKGSGRTEAPATRVDAAPAGMSLWGRFRRWYAGETREREA